MLKQIIPVIVHAIVIRFRVVRPMVVVTVHRIQVLRVIIRKKVILREPYGRINSVEVKRTITNTSDTMCLSLPYYQLIAKEIK